MEQSNLFETIFKRKSVRKYDLKPLEDKQLLEISYFINNLKPLFPDIKTQMRIVCQDEVKLLIPIITPHYLLIYSENKNGYLTNAGYMIQQVDLFLSSNNIGSCYIGMGQPKTAIPGLEFVMILAFGNAIDPIHRTSISEFNRKILSQITDNSNIDNILETARIAPSASNGQPWFFKGDGEVIHAYCVKPNIIKALLYEKMNKIDMGIALCHITYAAQHYGKEINFMHDQNAQDNEPKGYYYITSVNLK